MNIYYVTHKGMYLGGISIVAAENEAAALEVFTQMVEGEHQYLSEKILKGEIVITAFDTTSPNAVMIWNGDY